MKDILREAYARHHPADPAPVSLLDVLKAYEYVLRSYSRVPGENTMHYHLILKLSRDPRPDWWDKLAAFNQVGVLSFVLFVCLCGNLDRQPR